MPAKETGLMMVCPRNYTLRTTTGHVIEFKANVAKRVPDNCVELALAVNILPASKDATLPAHRDTSALGFTKVRAMPQLLREAIVMRCIDELVREGAKESFSGGGRPKVNVVRDRVGIDVTAGEMEKAWNRYRELIGANEDLPTHRNLDLVYDIQQTSSPKALREYAELLELTPAEIQGLSVSELKSALVAHAVVYNPDNQAAMAAATTLDEPLDE